MTLTGWLLLIALLGLVVGRAGRRRSRVPHVSDRWRRDHLYTHGKNEQ